MLSIVAVQKYTFYEKFVKGVASECWPWNGCCTPDGYGCFWYKGRNHGAHRLSYLFAYGHIPEGMCVCHTCDNPPCVNPAHLFLGTNTDNVMDREAKNRTCRGSKRPNAKLTDEDVLKIRRLYVPYKFGSMRLGRMFGVAKQTIETIVAGDAWKHLLPATFVAKPKSHTKLTDDQLREIIAIHSTGGVTNQDLAERFGVGSSTISRIVLRQTTQASHL